MSSRPKPNSSRPKDVARAVHVGKLISRQRICRNFMKHMCSRGDLCNYKHPDPDYARYLGKKNLVFCRHFQNNDCHYKNTKKCGFMHGTKQDEEFFKRTGFLPEHIIQSEVERKLLARGAKGVRGGRKNRKKVCKFFLKNACTRGDNCRNRHVAPTPSFSKSASQSSHTQGNPFDGTVGHDPDKSGGHEPVESGDHELVESSGHEPDESGGHDPVESGGHEPVESGGHEPDESGCHEPEPKRPALDSGVIDQHSQILEEENATPGQEK